MASIYATATGNGGFLGRELGKKFRVGTFLGGAVRRRGLLGRNDRFQIRGAGIAFVNNLVPLGVEDHDASRG